MELREKIARAAWDLTDVEKAALGNQLPQNSATALFRATS